MDKCVFSPLSVTGRLSPADSQRLNKLDLEEFLRKVSVQTSFLFFKV